MPHPIQLPAFRSLHPLGVGQEPLSRWARLGVGDVGKEVVTANPGGCAAESGGCRLDLAQGQQGLQSGPVFLEGRAGSVHIENPLQHQLQEGPELEIGHRKAVQGLVGGSRGARGRTAGTGMSQLPPGGGPGGCGTPEPGQWPAARSTTHRGRPRLRGARFSTWPPCPRCAGTPSSAHSMNDSVNKARPRKWRSWPPCASCLSCERHAPGPGSVASKTCINRDPWLTKQHSCCSNH